MRTNYKNNVTMDPSGFVLLADYIPHIVQEIRYYSTYNFIGERIDGYDQVVPCFDDGRFCRLDEVALLRDVLIGAVMDLAHAAHFAHVRLGDEVDVAADRRHVGRDFEVLSVG